MRGKAVAVLAITVLVASASRGEEKPPGIQVTGYVFGDAYWIATDHDPALEGENGFWIRRGYLTFDHTLSERLAARLRFEVNSPGDFRTSQRLEPFVKDAYLGWKFSEHTLYMGISPSPTWDKLEEVYGYRQVEKTPLDLQRMGDARGFGLALRGILGGARKVDYHVMLDNGAGVASETNEGKKAMLSVGFRPAEAFYVQLYADHDNRPAQTDRGTYQVWGAWQRRTATVGLFYARQVREGGGPNLALDLASVFGWVKMGERATFLGRLDRMFDPNPEGDRIPYLPFDPSARSTFVLAGVDFALHPKVNVIPNVETVLYDAPNGGPDPDSDLAARITLFYRF